MFFGDSLVFIKGKFSRKGETMVAVTFLIAAALVVPGILFFADWAIDRIFDGEQRRFESMEEDR